MKICPRCHGNNLTGWNACARCGVSFAVQPDSAPVPTAPPMDRAVGENQLTQIRSPQSSGPTMLIPSRLTTCIACGQAMGKTAKCCPRCGEQAEWHRRQAAKEAALNACLHAIDSCTFVAIVVGIAAVVVYLCCFCGVH